MRWFIGMLTVMGILTAGLTACASLGSTPGGPAPALDQSTPERTVESWWALQAWFEGEDRRIYGVILRQEYERGKRRELYAAISAGETQARLTDLDIPAPQRFERKILTSREEASRAEVVARIRNVTPIPEGAKVSDAVRERAAEGEVFRYFLVREPGGLWRVEQVLVRAGYSDEGWRKSFSPREFYLESPSP